MKANEAKEAGFDNQPYWIAFGAALVLQLIGLMAAFS